MSDIPKFCGNCGGVNLGVTDVPYKKKCLDCTYVTIISSPTYYYRSPEAIIIKGYPPYTNQEMEQLKCFPIDINCGSRQESENISSKQTVCDLFRNTPTC